MLKYPINLIVLLLWRVENGKIAEHWDVMETIADKSTWQILINFNKSPPSKIVRGTFIICF